MSELCVVFGCLSGMGVVQWVETDRHRDCFLCSLTAIPTNPALWWCGVLASFRMRRCEASPSLGWPLPVWGHPWARWKHLCMGRCSHGVHEPGEPRIKELKARRETFAFSEQFSVNHPMEIIPPPNTACKVARVACWTSGNLPRRLWKLGCCRSWLRPLEDWNRQRLILEQSSGICSLLPSSRMSWALLSLT